MSDPCNLLSGSGLRQHQGASGIIAKMKNVYRLATLLASQDTLQAYRRSVIGPFWLTIGMGIQILTMGIVFSLIFKSEIEEYLPFLAVSLILWGLIAGTINDGCTAFIGSEAMIKQLNIPHVVYVLRTVMKNLFSSAHNLIIVPFVFLVFQKPPMISLLLIVPGVALLVLNLSWVVFLLGIIAARFRDMLPIVNSATTIGFFVTPVMWSADLVGDNDLAHLLLGLNPLYHWLQIVRLPLLGGWPTEENWGLALLSSGCGWLVVHLVYKKFRPLIAYWV